MRAEREFGGMWNKVWLYTECRWKLFEEHLWNKVQSLPTKVQASKSDRKSPCGYIKLQRKFWSDRELWRGGTEAVEGKIEQIKEKCGEEREIIREEIRCLNKNRNNKNSGDVDAEQSSWKRILNLCVQEADNMIGNEVFGFSWRVRHYGGTQLPTRISCTFANVFWSKKLKATCFQPPEAPRALCNMRMSCCVLWNIQERQMTF